MAQDIENQQTGSSKPAKLEIAVYVLIALACTQMGYVGHPRYGPFIAAADVLCALLFLAWGVKVWRAGRLRKLTWPCRPVWAWTIIAGLSISMAAVGPEGGLSIAGIKAGIVEVAQIVLYFFAAYMLFVDILNNAAKLRRACLALLCATTAVVLWGLVDYARQADAFEVKAGFANRNIYSAFLVMVIPLLFGFFSRDDKWARWLTGVLVAGAMVTMLGPPHVWIMTGLLCWVAYGRGGRYRSRALPAIFAGALLIAIVLPRNHATNITEFFDPYEQGELYKLEATLDEFGADEEGETPQIVKKRWLEWQPALTMLSDNIALGVGAGSFQSRIGEAAEYSDGTLPNVKKSEPDTNNFYLVVGASMGFAGLVAVIAVLAWYWRRAISLWLRADNRIERSLATGLPAAVMGIALANIFTSLFVRGVSLVWALVFALVTVAAREGLAARQQGASNNTHME